MTLRTAALLLLAPTVLAACASIGCRAADDVRASCVDEARAIVGEFSQYVDDDIACEVFDNLYSNDPFFGASFTPDFACVERVWRAADCTTEEGVFAAADEEQRCGL